MYFIVINNKINVKMSYQNSTIDTEAKRCYWFKKVIY